MPELPEVQTIVNELNGSIRGSTIHSVVVFRETVIKGNKKRFIRRLAGKKILSIYRRGKYLIFGLTGGVNLLAHLRMTGKFIVRPADEIVRRRHDRVLFSLSENRGLIFSDVRCFGKLQLTENVSLHSEIANLGWEPWDPTLTAESLFQKISRKKTSIKAVLMDQRVIAGLGNIYVSEILFDSAIHPQVSVNKLSIGELEKIIRSMRKILTLALDKNGTSVSDYRRIDEKQGEFQDLLKVYGKTGLICQNCSSTIVRIKQHQRSTFLCPTCQKSSA